MSRCNKILKDTLRYQCSRYHELTVDTIPQKPIATFLLAIPSGFSLITEDAAYVIWETTSLGDFFQYVEPFVRFSIPNFMDDLSRC